MLQTSASAKIAIMVAPPSSRVSLTSVPPPPPPPPGSISSPGWRRGSVTPRVTTIPCPSCQHDIDLGERGISMLFRNFTLENIVERYRQAARAAMAIMCDGCKPPQQQEATKSCMDCRASYCNECFKLHHPWGTPKAQHEYVGPTTNFRPKVRRLAAGWGEKELPQNKLGGVQASPDIVFN